MAEADRQRLEIKKYPNRRFYDVTRSRHVTLDDLYRLVREGREIVVKDSKTGADITNVVLTQIILEHDPPKLNLFPASLLHQTIQANQQVVRRFIDEYFARAMDAFVQSRKHFEDFLARSGMAAMPSSLFDWMREMFPGSRRPADVGASPGTAEREDASRDPAIDELRRQVSALSEEVARLRPRFRRGKRKRR